MGDDPDSFFAKSLRSFQENVQRSGPAAAASYALIGAIVLLGGLGYLADWRFGTAPWLLLAGLLAGIVVGFYQLARAVWRP
jgi:F0F1-type ATP synthase assembly protein I